MEKGQLKLAQINPNILEAGCHVGGPLHPTHRARTNSTRHQASCDEGIFASVGVAIIGYGCIAVVALPIMALDIKLIDKACSVEQF